MSVLGKVDEVLSEGSLPVLRKYSLASGSTWSATCLSDFQNSLPRAKEMLEKTRSRKKEKGEMVRMMGRGKGDLIVFSVVSISGSRG